MSTVIPNTRWLIAENGVALGGERACDSCSCHTLFRISIEDGREPSSYLLCSNCDVERR